ncbi:MAG: PaaI family thioesterase [Pseudoclavibacter sp.]
MTDAPAAPPASDTIADAARSEAHRRARLEQILLDDHRTVTLGMQVTTLDADRIVVEQTVGPTDVNGLNLCHGGVIFTLADSATGIGANSLDDESAWVTVASEIHFRSPARIGDRLAATCELIEAASPRRRVFETVVRVVAPGDAPDAPAAADETIVATVDSTMVRLRELPVATATASA